MRTALAVLASAAIATTFAACVSTEDESAKIDRESRAAVAAEAAHEKAVEAKRHARERARHHHGGSGSGAGHSGASR